MIAENMVVYEALKNTALHCEDGIRNAKIQMYTVYFVMLPFSFAYHGIFLVTFIVLLAFQAIMNTERIAIERASSYIRVFFEEKRNDMHWSLLNKNPEHIASYSKQYKNIGWYVNTYAASILAIISFVSMVVVYTSQNYATGSIPLLAVIQICIALLLCILVIVVNTKYYDYRTGKKTIEVLDDGIRDFYKIYYDDSITTQSDEPNANGDQ